MKRASASSATGSRRGDQLALPLGKPASPADVEAVSIGRRLVTVRFVRHRGARRYVLRVLPDLTVRVTVPRAGTRAHAIAFLRRELRWLDLQRYAAARNAGALLFRGELLALQTDGTSPDRAVHIGGTRVPVRAGESPRQAAVRHLRALAGRELRDHLLALADRFGLPVKRITIRNQQTRWGSCSPHGAVALNWRLIQMPDSVRDYILIHELMHLRERNHSRRFWTLVEQACPDHRVARRWLKGHEAELL
jgi:predicted metal-dependent hydrolase